MHSWKCSSTGNRKELFTNETSSGVWNLLEKVSEKISQLVEVVRARDKYILADGDFIALTYLFNAKEHHRHILRQPGTFAYIASSGDDIAR